MSLFKDAFGGFEPRKDVDAAVKLAVNAILMDNRLQELECLLTDGHELGGMEGAPGWIIERRDTGTPRDMPYYAMWPVGSLFRAYVDPDGYELSHPEFFMDESTFFRYVSAGLRAYLKNRPDRSQSASGILSRVSV